MKIKVITSGWNAGPYIGKCIKSVLDQSYDNWDMAVILDPSEDNSYEIAVAASEGRVSVHQNKKRMYGIANQLKCVKTLKPNDDDILVWLDGDDWLYDENAFATLMRYYDADPNLLVTHGSWVSFPKAPPEAWHNNLPYTRAEFESGDIRHAPWKAAHLRTIKYRVFKQIKRESFLMPDGSYMITAFDIATMFPALEMAGFDRVKFIPETLHVYNRETPFGDWKVDPEGQNRVADYIKDMEPYQILEVVEHPEFEWLFDLEHDIAAGVDDCANLRGSFKKVFGREPR